MTVHVLQGAVDVPKDSLGRLRRRAMQGRPIFNPDDKRLQKSISRKLAVVRRAEAALEVEGLLNGRRISSPVVIQSKPGCKQQAWHCDYDPDAVEASECPPMGVVVALEGGTRFETPNHCYTLEAGDVLAFTGDTVHAGAAYTKGNTRIHFYLDTPEIPRPRDGTWLIKEK